MKKIKFCKYLMFIAIFIIATISLVSINDSPSNSKEELSELGYYELKTASSNGIISINNNTDLKQMATSGNGSESNPYIIEDKIINGYNNKYSILINNTNKHFIIQNCSFYNASYGIYLNNVTNGEVYDSFIYDNKITGIHLNNSTNITIHFIYIYSNVIYGIFGNQSFTNEFIRNSLSDNNYTGIYLKDANNNTLLNNIISNHDYAIILHSSNYSQVLYNIGYFNNHTIEQINCFGNILISNFIEVIIIRNSNDDNNNNNNNLDEIFLDFTLILLLGIIICSMLLIYRKISIFRA